jgi:thioredoxin 1
MPRFARVLRACLTTFALMFMALAARALSFEPYTPEALEAAQKAGKAVAVHFHADWCPTCKLQQKSFAKLQAERSLPLTVLVADYDKVRELKRVMNVRQQSTLVVFRGGEEKGRVTGEAAPDKLRAALNQAL